MEQEVGTLAPQASTQILSGWGRIRSRLREEVGESEYKSWLRQMTLLGVRGDEAVIVLPTRFMRDWVKSHYGDRLRALWQAECPTVRRVEIKVAPSGGTEVPPVVPKPDDEVGTPDDALDAPAESGLAQSLSTSDRTEPRLPSVSSQSRSDWVAPLENRFTFDTFVVGKPNEFAHACARRVAERPAFPGFNPLFLYGGVGLGKTHLMHAIAWAIRDLQPSCTVAYMSAEKFMYRFIAALRSQNTMQFKETLRAVDVLMIDDLQFLIGKDNTQEEFFHTFNALVDQGKQIVVSSDKPPSDLAGIEDRLRTRLGCGMVADIHATTYELRLSILEAKAAATDVAVPPRVLELLAHKIATNIRELEGALKPATRPCQPVRSSGSP